MSFVFAKTMDWFKFYVMIGYNSAASILNFIYIYI